MTQKLLMALLAGAALLASAPVFAHDDEDEDDDDWKEHRREHHRYRYYERPPIVIYRDRSPARPPEPTPKRPENFPKESPADRAAAKERQRGILEKELAAEQALLDDARKEPGDGTKDSVEGHQRNIEALKRELRNLNR